MAGPLAAAPMRARISTPISSSTFAVTSSASSSSLPPPTSQSTKPQYTMPRPHFILSGEPNIDTPLDGTDNIIPQSNNCPRPRGKYPVSGYRLSRWWPGHRSVAAKGSVAARGGARHAGTCVWRVCNALGRRAPMHARARAHSSLSKRLSSMSSTASCFVSIVTCSRSSCATICSNTRTSTRTHAATINAITCVFLPTPSASFAPPPPFVRPYSQPRSRVARLTAHQIRTNIHSCTGCNRHALASQHSITASTVDHTKDAPPAPLVHAHRRRANPERSLCSEHSPSPWLRARGIRSARTHPHGGVRASRSDLGDGGHIGLLVGGAHCINSHSHRGGDYTLGRCHSNLPRSNPITSNVPARAGSGRRQRAHQETQL